METAREPKQGAAPRRVRRAAILVGFGVALALTILIVRGRGEPPRVGAQVADTPLPPPNDVTELLGGLKPGDDLDGWTVRAIFGPKVPRPAPDPNERHQNMITIDVDKGSVGISVYVARKGAAPFAPPHETNQYAIYFGGQRPPEAMVSQDQFERVMGAVMRRVRETEATAALPDGM